MTLVFYYTDGVNTTSISGATPFPFGTAVSRGISSVVYDAMVTALVAAGWTRYNKGTRNDVWASSGEDGTRYIYGQTYLRPSLAYLTVLIGTKLSATNDLMGNIGALDGGGHYIDLDETTSYDYMIFATKDFMWLHIKSNSSSSIWNIFMGQAIRPSTLPVPVTLTSAVTPGTFVSLPVSANPITLGYQINDMVQLVEVGASSNAAVASWGRIVGLSTSSIIVDNLAVGFTTAVVGLCPLPTVRFIGANSDPDISLRWRSVLPVTPSSDQTNELDVGGTGVLLRADFAPGISGVQYDNACGSGTSTANAAPNKRGNTFILKPLCLTRQPDGISTRYEGFVGYVPGVYLFPGTDTLYSYPCDTGTDTSVVPNRRYVAAMFTFNSGNDSYRPWIFGPVA